MIISGGQNFLEGIAAVADTILKDASGIAQLRVQSSRMKAQADLGLMAAQYQAQINSYKIKPEDFESSFAEFRAGLDEYADNLDFGPAKEAVRADARSMLPQLYAQSAAVMNRTQLERASADWLVGYQTLLDSPMRSDAKHKALTEYLNDGKELGFIDQGKIASLEMQENEQFQYDSLFEKALSYGSTAEALDALATPNGQFSNSPEAAQRRVAQQLQKQLESNGKALLQNTGQALAKLGDAFAINPESMVQAIEDSDATRSSKDEALAMLAKHQSEALVSYYRGGINSYWSNPKGLSELLVDLETENSWDGGLEKWAGPYEEKRTELLRIIKTRINEIGENADGEAKKTATGKADISYIMQQFASGAPSADNDGEPLSYGNVVATLEVIRARDGNAVAEDVDQALRSLEKHLPPGGETYLKKLVGVFDKGGKLEGKKGNEVEAWAIDEFHRRALVKPNATSTEMDTWIAEIISPYLAKKIDILMSEAPMTEGIVGFDAKLNAVGAALQSGQAAAVVNLDPRHRNAVTYAKGYGVIPEQAYGLLTKKANEEYGVSATPVVNEDGTFLLQDSKGNQYQWVFTDGRRELHTYSKGNVGARVVPKDKPKPPTTGDGHVVGTVASRIDVGEATKKQKALEEIQASGFAKKAPLVRAARFGEMINAGVLTEADILKMGYNRDGTVKQPTVD